MIRTATMVRLAAAAAAVLLAAPALGGGKLQKLPPDYVFARGDGSPGPVMFSHATHVDAAKPDCASCHARTFRILEAGKTTNGDPIRHDRMEKGAACGACHGKTAFGFDSCEMCHKS